MTFLQKLEAAEEPQHIGATCPKCQESLGTPYILTGLDRSANVRHMLCPLCGHEWRTEDVEEIAAAFYGFAAYGRDARISEELAADQGATP